MKRTKSIFIFIFLLGMLFTVFQYIPILEEETPGHKVELVKKSKQGDLADGDGDGADEDCDDNDDSEQEIYYYCSAIYNIFYLESRSGFPDRNNSYKYLLEHRDTPPPKV